MGQVEGSPSRSMPTGTAPQRPVLLAVDQQLGEGGLTEEGVVVGSLWAASTEQLIGGVGGGPSYRRDHGQ